jgi:NAD(P)-dependent dehydrogenase (short-subunit alcohol dehydrogenase family)
VSVRFPGHPDRRPALVTGASSGIGEATARALAAAGHPVALGARRVERCEAVAAEICADGGEAVVFPLDVADAGSVKDFVAEATGALGPIEVLISNAGDTALGRAVETQPDDFAGQVRVNLLAAHQLVSLLAPSMVERRRGDLVFVSSDSVRTPRPGISAYVTAKWGLEGLARTLQMELEGTGVRASIVRPGPTMTDMGRDWDPAGFAALVDQWLHWGVARHDHFLRPADVARAVVGVVSMPRGAHVTLVEVEPEAPITEGGDE